MALCDDGGHVALDPHPVTILGMGVPAVGPAVDVPEHVVAEGSLVRELPDLTSDGGADEGRDHQGGRDTGSEQDSAAHGAIMGCEGWRHKNGVRASYAAGHVRPSPETDALDPASEASRCDSVTR